MIIEKRLKVDHLARLPGFCPKKSTAQHLDLRAQASAKIHPDQAGFVPGRLITDHTRLASEVAHLSDTSGTDGYIVSLDQAKAYDRTDLSCLLRVLTAMNIPADLISLIEDVTHNNRTRVRI